MSIRREYEGVIDIKNSGENKLLFVIGAEAVAE